MDEELEGRGQGLDWTRLSILNSGEHCRINFDIVKSTLNFTTLCQIWRSHSF